MSPLINWLLFTPCLVRAFASGSINTPHGSIEDVHGLSWYLSSTLLECISISLFFFSGSLRFLFVFWYLLVSQCYECFIEIRYQIFKKMKYFLVSNLFILFLPLAISLSLYLVILFLVVLNSITFWVGDLFLLENTFSASPCV